MTTGDGRIVWTDLTVGDADAIAAFYERVVGWRRAEVAVGGYADFAMHAPSPPDPGPPRAPADGPVAGICHARGENANLPPVWLPYVQVPDVAHAVRAALAHGGAVVDGPRPMGRSVFAVVRDPAGACIALISSADPDPSPSPDATPGRPSGG